MNCSLLLLQSSLDVMVLSQFWPKNCTIMMKKSLVFLPIFGFVALLVCSLNFCIFFPDLFFWSFIFQCRSVFVDRFNHKKALQSLTKCADNILSKNLSVVVFPEGTRNHEGGMLTFKKGAFNIAVQVGRNNVTRSYLYSF